MKRVLRIFLIIAGLIAFIYVGTLISSILPRESSEPTEYTEEEIRQIKDDAYSDGYSDGYNEGEEIGYENGYYDGENGILYQGEHAPSSIVYYVPGGHSYHIDPNCIALQNSDNVRQAYLNDIQEERDACDYCTPTS